MKNKVLLRLVMLSLFMAFCVGSSAQEDYEPFIKTGKTWYVYQFGLWGEYKDQPKIVDCRFTDETVEKSDGIYTKMYVRWNKGGADVELFREERKRVYHFNEVLQKGELLFDFSLEVGDTVVHNEDSITYNVINRSLVQDGTARPKTKITLRSRDNTNAYPDEEWIEGIGSLQGYPTLNFPLSLVSSYGFHVVYVYDGNEYQTFDFALPHNNWWGSRVKSQPMKGVSAPSREGSLRYNLTGETLYVDGWITTDSPLIYAHCRQTGQDSLQIFFEDCGQKNETASKYQVHFAFPKLIEKKYTVTDPYGTTVVEENSNSQYQPMISQGKTWFCVNVSKELKLGDKIHAYKIMGDTVINNQLYAKIMYRDYDKEQSEWIYYAAVREDNEKMRVYMVEKASEEESLLYNFDFVSDERLYYYEHGGYLNYGTHQVMIKGINRNYIKCVCYVICDGEIDFTTRLYFVIEGIGFLPSPFDISTWFTDYSRMIACYENDVCVADANDFLYSYENNALIEKVAQLVQTGINNINSDAPENDSARSIYSLDGRRLQQVPEKGVYIVNGRKMVRK